MKRIHFLFLLLAFTGVLVKAEACQLMKAARDADLVEIQALIDAKDEADKVSFVNTEGKCGHTPLIWAVLYDNDAAARLLLTNGADPSLTGGLALHLAVEQNDEALVSDFIAAGATVDAASLFAAVENGNLSMLELLVSEGGDVSVLDAGGSSLLLRAIAKKATDVVSYLIGAGADLDVVNKFGQFPLFVAVTNRDLSTVQALIAAGADVRLLDDAALEKAASVRDLDIIEELVDAGASLDADMSSAFKGAFGIKDTALLGALLGDGSNEPV